MRKLALPVFLALAGLVVLGSGCGDDDGRPMIMPDSGPPPSDTGAPVDTGTPPADTGAPVDTGTPTDTGTPPTGMCPTGACDLLTNAGCEAGNACYFAAAAAGEPPAPQCALAGTAGDGAACTQLQDCREGFLCDTGAGVCRHYCCMGSDTGCPIGQSCLVTITGEDMMPTGVGFCRLPDTCDLLAQTGCPAGQGCFPAGGDGSVICGMSDNVAEGGSCTYTNDCAPGYACINDPGTCAKICDMAAGTGCMAGQTCSGVTNFPTGVGICTPPMGG